ncbi:MAG: hypothetical protein EBY17_30550, partial [Acidobacteriia bacterium]|nr:hypothetical protein [Terriglobia bacterium]
MLGVWVSSNWVGGLQPSAEPAFSHLLFFILDAVQFAKLHAPLSLLLLGISGYVFCQQSKLYPAVGLLVAAAVALNTNPLSYACWGLPPKALALGCTLAALGLLQGGFQTGWRGWLRVLLAGLCVGLNVVEGADVGAILSLYVAAFAVWQMFAEPGAKVANALRGAGRLALVAVCAGWIAAHALA